MASPYLAITDLIDHWPESTNRHEIFMVTSGIDALQPGLSNSYLDKAIERAQLAQRPAFRSTRSMPRGQAIGAILFGGSTGGKTTFHGWPTKLALKLISRDSKCRSHSRHI
jgi:hypothetical protein